MRLPTPVAAAPRRSGENESVRVAVVLLLPLLVVGCGSAGGDDAARANPDDPGVIIFNLNADSRLRAIRPDGTGLQPVKLRKSCDPRDFSNDAQIVACDSFPFGIYLMRRDGSDWRRLPLPPGNSHSPSLSPNGDELVYLYSADEYGNTFELWKVSADGGDAHRLVGGDYQEPTWSPDGERIAFIREPPKAISAGECFNGELVVMDADGGGERLLARNSAAPEWSPDGKRLAFESDCGTISTVSVEGGRPAALARGGGWVRWSPDGSRIAFIRETGPCGHATCMQRISVVPATGGKPRPIGPLIFDPFAFFWLPTSAASPDSDATNSR